MDSCISFCVNVWVLVWNFVGGKVQDYIRIDIWGRNLDINMFLGGNWDKKKKKKKIGFWKL